MKCFFQKPTTCWKQGKTKIQIFWFPCSGALSALPGYLSRITQFVFKLCISQSDPVSLRFCSDSSKEEREFPYSSLNLLSCLQITQHSLCACLPCWRGSVPGIWKSHLLYCLFSSWPDNVSAFNQMHPGSSQSKIAEEPVRGVVSLITVFCVFCVSLDEIWMSSLWNKR